MDSVIMTTPSNSTRLRSRLRSAANTICARSSKRSGSGLSNKTHHRTNGAVTARSLVNRHHQHQHQPASKHNNVNLRCAVAPSCDNDNGNNDKLKAPVGLVNTESITREVYNAWCGRLGDVTRIPSDSVQALFNEMQLYPSKNQVVEMLQCARQCGHRNSSQFLTFGEFCVFAGELRRGGARNQHPNYQHSKSQEQQRSLSGNNTSLSQCEVFLGGSCNPTTWRADIAIPALSKFGITYYNPQVTTWSPELMTAEHTAKESADVLLFVVDSQTRCIAGMLEVAHLVAKKRCLVLVVDPFKRSQAIMGETLSMQEFEDLTEGQATLLTLVRSQGVTVHSNLSTALHCTVSLLRGSGSTLESATERKLSEKLMKLREVFDSVDTNHTSELSLSEVSNAYYQLTGSSLRISDLHAIMNLSQQQQQRCSGDVSDVRISFEQFCGIVAEFTTIDGCSVNNRINGTDGAHRFTNPTYWKLAMLRTQQLLRIYVIRPIVQIIDWVNQPVQTQSSTNNNFNYSKPQNGYHINETSPNERFDIYLGGSCMKRTTWRQNIAIPLLKRYGISYYNPSLHENISLLNGNMNDNSPTEIPIVRSASRDLLHDMDVMNESKIVLFVITNETRSITSMILAAHYIALKRNVVLCVQQLSSEDCTIGSDVITKQAIKDYNRARAYLTDLAKHENVSTFESVQEAVEYAVNLVQIQHHER